MVEVMLRNRMVFIRVDTSVRKIKHQK